MLFWSFIRNLNALSCSNYIFLVEGSFSTNICTFWSNLPFGGFDNDSILKFPNVHVLKSHNHTFTWAKMIDNVVTTANKRQLHWHQNTQKWILKFNLLMLLYLFYMCLSFNSCTWSACTLVPVFCISLAY